MGRSARNFWSEIHRSSWNPLEQVFGGAAPRNVYTRYTIPIHTREECALENGGVSLQKMRSTYVRDVALKTNIGSDDKRRSAATVEYVRYNYSSSSFPYVFLLSLQLSIAYDQRLLLVLLRTQFRAAECDKMYRACIANPVYRNEVQREYLPIIFADSVERRRPPIYVYVYVYV